MIAQLVFSASIFTSFRSHIDPQRQSKSSASTAPMFRRVHGNLRRRHVGVVDVLQQSLDRTPPGACRGCAQSWWCPSSPSPNPKIPPCKPPARRRPGRLHDMLGQTPAVVLSSSAVVLSSSIIRSQVEERGTWMRWCRRACRWSRRRCARSGRRR